MIINDYLNSFFYTSNISPYERFKQYLCSQNKQSKLAITILGKEVRNRNTNIIFSILWNLYLNFYTHICTYTNRITQKSTFIFPPGLSRKQMLLLGFVGVMVNLQCELEQIFIIFFYKRIYCAPSHKAWRIQPKINCLTMCKLNCSKMRTNERSGYKGSLKQGFQNHLGDTPLGVSVRAFPKNFNEERKTYSEYGLCHSMN